LSEKADAAIRLEHLWDETARRFDVDILCGYVLKQLSVPTGGYIYQRVSSRSYRLSAQIV
jgi:hypothetical protein